MSTAVKARTIILVAISLVGTAVIGPTGAGAAGDARTEREQIRARKATAAAELNTVNASDDELDAALAALDDQVTGQSAQVESARQAVAAAEAEQAAAQTRVVETQGQISVATAALVERAVRAFMEPETDGIEDVVSSEDVSEAARKQAMLDHVAANNEDVIDALNLAREDFEVARGEAEALAAAAAERRAQAEAELASLEAARAEKAKLEAAVEARQKELLAEIDSLASNEAELNRKIARAQATVASRRSGPPASRGGVDGGVSGGRSGAGGCIWPVSGSLSSGFGYRWGRLHAGVDIAASTGTPIHASVAGVVVFAGVQSGYGNVVVLDHGGGFTTLYGHQSRLGSSVGQSVGQGATIGFVGSTGRSTGPHLHFETRYGGSPRDPRSCLS